MSESSAAKPRALEALRQELETTRHQVAELEALLAELPNIFERKFQQRLMPIQDQQRMLNDENRALREQASFLLPGGNQEASRASLPPTGHLGSITRRLLSGVSGPPTDGSVSPTRR